MTDRSMTYLEDFVGAISTCLSITAGVINMLSGTTSTEWQTAYATELGWSGIIEASAIAAVLLTDSDVLRAIGGFSMLGVNATSMYLINKANNGEASSNFTLTYTLHAIAFGQALGVFIATFLVNKDGELKWFNPLNQTNGTAFDVFGLFDLY